MQRGLANKETAWLRVAWLMARLGYCSCHNTTPPASESSFICDVPHFQTHQPTPPSFLPPVSESSFVMCHISKLTNPLLPPPSSSPLASESSFAMCHVSELTNPLLLPPSSSPLASESLFATCHVSELTNMLLPFLPSTQLVLSNMPCFQAHKCTPPSSFPPVVDSSFAMYNL